MLESVDAVRPPSRTSGRPRSSDGHPAVPPRRWGAVAAAVVVLALVVTGGHLLLATAHALGAAPSPTATTARAHIAWLRLAVATGTSAAVVVGLRVHRPARPGPWLVVLAMLVVWGCAPAAALVTGTPLPRPSEVGLSAIALLLLVVNGLQLLRAVDRALDLSGRLDAAVVVVGYLGLCLPTQIVPGLTADTVLTERLVVGVLAPLAITVSLVTMTRLLYLGVVRTAAARLFVAGWAALLVPAALLGPAPLSGDGLGHLVRFAPLVLLIGAAALHPLMGTVTAPPAARGSTDLSRWRFLATFVAGCLPPIGLVVTDQRADWEEPVVLAIAIVTVALVVARSRVAVRMLAGANRDLRRRAVTDGLTGLRNWRGVREAVGAGPGPVVLLFCDLDGFGRLNTEIGHATGDEVLREVAARMRATVASGSAVGRLGNDEFAVVLAGQVDPAAVAQTADALRAAVSTPITTADGRAVQLSLSVGVGRSGTGAPLPAEGVFDELVRTADLALRQAKQDGGDRVVWHSDELEQRVRREAAIRAALDRPELLSLHHQAVVDLPTGAVVGTEALVRLTVPGLGPVPPSEFVPVAVRSGRVHALGEWVLRRAVADHRAARDRLPAGFTLAVNVSARQLDSGALVDLVREVVGQDDPLAAALRLEITESEVSGPGAVQELRRLADAGFHLVIDDFGTEYASLQYLTHLPVTALKLDRSFTDRLPHSRVDRAVVRHVLALGRELGVEIIAEGVEQQEQADLLTGLGCTRAQGYLFDRPAPGLERFAAGQPTSAASMSEARAAGEVVEP